MEKPLQEIPPTSQTQPFDTIASSLFPTQPIPVHIHLRAIQIVDGESDVTEIFTYGTVYLKNGKYYVVYEELLLQEDPLPFEESDGDPHIKTVTTVKLDSPEKITLTRHGGTRSSLVIERGVRHVGFYSTDAGNFTLGVSGADIKVEMTDTSATIYFKYALDINTSHLSNHEILLKIKPQAVEERESEILTPRETMEEQE